MQQADSALVAILCVALKIERPTDSGITSRIGKKASRSESSWIDLYVSVQRPIPFFGAVGLANAR